ncbi:hypothetical protein [Candidatus Frankia alpina]|uniref:Uncharacterized protein n=1 Tax=Candidatus Frankia alpina TaxID=2699483 RepID=A0A4S5EAU2_9ACTN|nr:hypothetical protein [Candidatus Frankia alpina]THJ68814.1 hypothetical protein E7Y31_16670 [Candidatus Frankia alpina]
MAGRQSGRLWQYARCDMEFDVAVPYTKGLHEVAAGIWAWLAPDGSWGWSNAGLVTGQDSSLLVDTLFDLELTREMLTTMAPNHRAAADQRPGQHPWKRRPLLR